MSEHGYQAATILRRRTRIVLIGAALPVALLLCGCGGEGEPTADGAAAASRPADPSPAALGKVTPTPAAQIKARIAGQAGKVVLVDIWATWCGSCKEAFPEVVAFHRKYAGQGLAVISVNWDAEEDRGLAEAFARGAEAPFESFLATDDQQTVVRTIDEDWSGQVPCVILYDRAGRRRHLIEGETSTEALEREIVQLLTESP